jgi:hypothetical protein
MSECLARALGGLRLGTGWVARCPAHDDSTPSLSITVSKDGKLLVHCHAGCSQDLVISVLRERGLWGVCPTDDSGKRSAANAKPILIFEPNVKQRIARALKLWCETRTAAGTSVETYLRSRRNCVERNAK